jgi:hypothetical protein
MDIRDVVDVGDVEDITLSVAGSLAPLLPGGVA